MCDKLMTELIAEQSFDPPQTAATETLKHAAEAYHSGDIVRSANLFLKSWRILHIEHLNYVGGRFDLLPPWNTRISEPRSDVDEDFSHHELIRENLARESQARILMGLCALCDLALACLGCTGEYKDKNYNWNSCDGTQGYALDINALENVDFGDMTTEELDFEGKIWPKGSRLSFMFKRVDDMGYKIKSVDSFSKAAFIFASFGLFQLALAIDLGKEHSDYRKVVKDAIEQVLRLAKQKVSARKHSKLATEDKEL